MAATARAVTADEEGPGLGGGHSPKLTALRRAEYQAGLESWIGTIRQAAPELKKVVFENAASECAGYVRGGFSSRSSSIA